MTDTKAEELLPVTLKACPFCGGQPTITRDSYVETLRPELYPEGGRSWVYCGNCTALHKKNTQAEAASGWNHRIDSQAELVEAVKEIDALTRDGRDIVSRQVSRVTSRLIARLGTPS